MYQLRKTPKPYRKTYKQAVPQPPGQVTTDLIYSKHLICFTYSRNCKNPTFSQKKCDTLSIYCSICSNMSSNCVNLGDDAAMQYGDWQRLGISILYYMYHYVPTSLCAATLNDRQFNQLDPPNVKLHHLNLEIAAIGDDFATIRDAP